MDIQLKKGALELCVLSTIERKDLYGYELVELISQHVDISEGTVYPLLRRMLDDGHCESYLKESDQGPPRKYYRITKKGKKFLQVKIFEWRSFVDSVESLLKEGKSHESKRVFKHA